MIYKLIAKVLANRLKRVLPYCIVEAQIGFVPGRLIMDNAIIAFEGFQWLQQSRNRREKLMAIKLDMNKAYDSVEWDFLKWMMEVLKFPPYFISLIMQCIISISFQVLINGEAEF